jgi:hypothetical protein
MSGDSVGLINNGVNNVVKISGQTVLIGGSLATNISGNQIRLTDDGINNVVKISGQKVGIIDDSIQNVVKVSGQTVRLPNDGINNVVQISGQVTIEVGTTPRTGTHVAVTGASGGTQLPNAPGFSVLLRNISGNQVMFVGSTTNPPEITSPLGVPIYGGESITVKVTNANKLRVAASKSGENLAWFTMDV